VLQSLRLILPHRHDDIADQHDVGDNGRQTTRVRRLAYRVVLVKNDLWSRGLRDEGEIEWLNGMGKSCCHGNRKGG
jgi:hypothetical protein